MSADGASKMTIRKPLLIEIFEAANIRRWNDKICPVELRELDKQAHKSVIAFVLGKLTEASGETVDWQVVMESCIFGFLQRLVLIDIKPQILHEIRKDRALYADLNEWVFRRLHPVLSPLGQTFLRDFRDHLASSNRSLSKRIVEAAHFYATKWEFDIIERANPSGYEIDDIRERLLQQTEEYNDLRGVQQLVLCRNYRNFIDLCGELRFQLRWSQIGHRVPRTSVLGHTFVVALLSYLFSLEIKACPQRRYNNFYTGLFHDLPEVLTRDVVDPVKRSVPGLGRVIRKYERKQMEEVVIPLIPKEWQPEMRLFTGTMQGIDEFSDVVLHRGRLKKASEQQMKSHNRDSKNPRDGRIVQASDDLTAYIEAYLAKKSGIVSPYLDKAVSSLEKKYETKVVSGIDFGEIYADFPDY
jgi:putative hydrolase of HD superfamily